MGAATPMATRSTIKLIRIFFMASS